MHLILSSCRDEDFNLELSNVFFDAFDGTSNFMNAMHPHNMTPEGRQKAARFFRGQSKDPAQRWVRVIDIDNDAVAGMAQYAVWEKANAGKMPVNPLEGAPDGNWESVEDGEYAQALWKSFIENQNQVLSERPSAIVCPCFWFHHTAVCSPLTAL